MMHPAFTVLANRRLTFSLYDFHLAGVSASELAQAFDLPLYWVEERLEAVRLCLKYQVRLSFATADADQPARMPSHVICRPPKVVDIRARA